MSPKIKTASAVQAEEDNRQDWRISLAYHEAGHVLTGLYFGFPMKHAVVCTRMQRRRRNGVPDNAGGYTRFIVPETSPGDFYPAQSLINLAGGPIAQAHYEAEWPSRKRALHHTFIQFYGSGPLSDAERFGRILEDFWDGKDRQIQVIEEVWKRTQALIRSEPGWHFVTMLSAMILSSERGRVGYRQCAATFKAAFGRGHPRADTWERHWPPTLTQFRTGWLPPQG